MIALMIALMIVPNDCPNDCFPRGGRRLSRAGRLVRTTRVTTVLALVCTIGPTAQQKLEGAADFCPEDTPTRLLMKEMKRRSIDPSVRTDCLMA
eukprot:3911732-Prymnesium_polylepis.1